MYCPVVLKSPDWSFEKKESNAKMEPSCRPRFCTQSGPCLSWESVCDNVIGKFWFTRSFSSQLYSNFSPNNTSENVSQIRAKKRKPRSFICKVNLNFLRSSRHFNCDTVFAVIVFFLNESVHGFNNIRNGRVKTRFQIVEF